MGAVVLGGAGVVTYAMADPGNGAGSENEPRRASAVHTLGLTTKGSDRKVVPQKSTDRFSAVILTWKNPHTKLAGTAQVRARNVGSGAWTDWLSMPVENLGTDGKETKAGGGVRGGTESVWTGDSDAVELRVIAEDGSVSSLPSGMDAKLLDPGTLPPAKGAAKGVAKGAGAAQPAAFSAETTPAAEPDTTATTDAPATEPAAPASESASPAASPIDSADPSASASPDPSETPSPDPTQTIPTPLPSTVVKPPIITQAEWGADTNYNGTPEYDGSIKAAVVHHTGEDSDNAVPCSQSRQRVHTVQQGHMAKGWYDIGYNFLVDRCGQIFEGRSGGMDLPVHGAHDYGFNTDTVGISYIGNFMTAKPTPAALNSIARVVAWKFGQYGITANSKVTLTSNGDQGVSDNKIPLGQSVTLDRVFGHRDTGTTLCPGDNLYGKLATIRTLASAPGVSHALATSDIYSSAAPTAATRDGLADIVAGTPKASSGGSITVVPGGTNGPAYAAKKTLTQSSTGVPGANEPGDLWGAAVAEGDINGDGFADLAIGQPGENDTSGHTDRGAVTLLYGPALNTGDQMNLDEGFYANGAKYGSAVAVGDFNADGKADVFAASTGTGGTWTARYSGDRESSSNITSGDAALSYEAATSGDFNQDGYADVALNYHDSTSVGRVIWFKGGRNGLTKAGTLTVKGGRSIAAGDLNGDGVDDIVIGQPYTAESGAYAGGQVTAVYGSKITSTTAGGLTATGAKTIHQATAGVPGAAESGDALGASVAVGDYNADGYADVLAGAPGEDITRTTARKDAGTSLLFKGSSAGLTGTGSIAVSQDEPGVPGASESGDKLGSAVSLTDLSGYGRADLVIGAMGEDSGNGTLLYVPSNSTGIGLATSKYVGLTQLGTPKGAEVGTTLAP
ncbi:FG-GAP-like repeat-containing protein [Streptomyces sp. NPDC046821]|uniref:FG-GAP-like repeat-containing protein n=1 Tax=Streptomyces sp. NPDC046821 TaxID=3154702 RepID=UPI0033C96AAD